MSKNIRLCITLSPEHIDYVRHHAALERRRVLDMIRLMILEYQPAKTPAESRPPEKRKHDDFDPSLFDND